MLLNKYKFVIVAKTIAELKQKIVEKLESKNQIEKTDVVRIKDTSDFELGSDDEVDDVVPDCKIRIYVEQKVKAAEKKQEQQPVPVVPAAQPAQVSVSVVPVPVVAPVVGSNVAVDIPIINTANWTQPIVS